MDPVSHVWKPTLERLVVGLMIGVTIGYLVAVAHSDFKMTGDSFIVGKVTVGVVTSIYMLLGISHLRRHHAKWKAESRSEDDPELGNLLRDALRNEPAVQTPECPSVDDLWSYVCADLPISKRDAITKHLASCAYCVKSVGRMHRGRESVKI